MYSPAQEVPGTPRMDPRAAIDWDLASQDAVVPQDLEEESADDSYSVPGTPASVHDVHRAPLVNTPSALSRTPSTRTPSSRTPSSSTITSSTLSATTLRTPTSRTTRHFDTSDVFRTPCPVLPSPLCEQASSLKEQVVPSTPTSSQNKSPRILRTNVRLTPSPICKETNTPKKNRTLKHVVDATGDHGPAAMETSGSRGRRTAVLRYRRSTEAFMPVQSSRRNIMESPDFLDVI